MNKKEAMLRKGIIGVVTTSILVSSCTIDHLEYNRTNGLYDHLWASSDPDLGEQLLNIENIQLSNKIQEYARIVGFLIEDVTKDKVSAQLFCSDPDAYLAQKKIKDAFDINIDQYLTDKDKRLIMAFADDEVRSAAKRQDLAEFLRLCKSKGLLSNPVKVISEGYANYSEFFKSTEEYVSFMKHLNDLTNPSGVVLQNDDSEAFVLALVVGIRLGAIAEDYVYDQVEFWGAAQAPAISKVINEEPTLKFWINEHSETYIPSELLFEELVLQTADNLAQVVVENFPHYDRDKIKEFIAINLQNFYDIKK